MSKIISIAGLFAVVFVVLMISRAIGSSEFSQLFGAIVGSGTYILLECKK